MKLLSTSTWPPKGWIYFDPKTNWREPDPMSNSFEVVAQHILKVRANNAHVYPEKNQRTIEASRSDLERYTILRLLRDGHTQHVALEPGDDQILAEQHITLKKKQLNTHNPSPVPPHLPAAPGAADKNVSDSWFDKIKQLAIGISTLRDWLGDGAQPVSNIDASKRASICAMCPMNDTTGSWLDWFTGGAVNTIKAQLEARQKLSLETPHDSKLGVCHACGCQLHLKVHVPIKTIMEHLPATDFDKLHGNCWIRHENALARHSRRGAASRNPLGNISVQRLGAMGDVVMATVVAKKLREVADFVDFYTVGVLNELICHLPFIRKVETGLRIGRHGIDLDHAYEKLSNQERKTNPIPELFMKCAVSYLAARNISLQHPLANLTPDLIVTPNELELAQAQLASWPRPIIAVVPRSNSWPCRTINQASWEDFAKQLYGTCIPMWTGTDPAPEGFFDLKCRSLRQLMAILKSSDIAVGVDTGPMHLAAAVGTPLVHVTQSVAGIMTLPQQRDWIAFDPELDCIACHNWKCPINEMAPPCQNLSGAALAALVKTRLGSRSSGSVSAIIATYRPDPERINRAIAHVLPQVDEIVIALDGDTQPSGITTGPKIRFVQHYSRKRRGFGKTFNLGARHAHGEFLLSINDDVFLDQWASHRMRDALRADLKAAVVGCLLRYPDNTIQHGGTRRFDTGYGHLDLRQAQPSIRTRTEMESVTFAASMFRRSIFFDLKGFDERYDCYWEDPDFCLRARKAGYKVYYEPNATGTHIESATTNGMDKGRMLQEGGQIFHSLWMEYFRRNRNFEGLGTFA